MLLILYYVQIFLYMLVCLETTSAQNQIGCNENKAIHIDGRTLPLSCCSSFCKSLNRLLSSSLTVCRVSISCFPLLFLGGGAEVGVVAAILPK